MNSMKVTKISAITIFTKNMKNSCMFYSGIPKFELTYGGPSTNFSTFRISESPEMFLNIESSVAQNLSGKSTIDFRIIFYTEDVDTLYYYLRNDDTVSNLGKFETKPADAVWGERFFQMRDPDEYTIVFATPISKND
tara:strand:+ start:19512 stop:19922 length:411 start_codon:yes stop_codon:yes gene_type:complete